MTLKDNLPKIALGAWAWGNDGTFGNEHKIEDLKPIYDKSMELGLNLWDTAYVYGMGKSEEVLGEFLKTSNREDFVISTKFTLLEHRNGLKSWLKQQKSMILK